MLSFSKLFKLMVLTFSSILVPHHMVTIINAKKSSGSALLTGSNSQFLLAKFAILPRSIGHFRLSLSIPESTGMYADERSLRVHLFIDKAWHDKARKAPTCREKVKYAYNALPVTLNLQRLSSEKESS